MQHKPDASSSPGSTPAAPSRPSVVVRPGSFLTLVILSVVLAGLAIYWLLRSMRI
jgi:hypothetical protein